MSPEDPRVQAIAEALARNCALHRGRAGICSAPAHMDDALAALSALDQYDRENPAAPPEKDPDRFRRPTYWCIAHSLYHAFPDGRCSITPKETP